MGNDAQELHMTCLQLAGNKPTWLLTRYYPEGVDALHYDKARKGVEELAVRLAEPVMLSIYSPYLHNSNRDELPIISSLFLPANVAHGSESPLLHGIHGWLPVYLQQPHRYVSGQELRATLALSGAAADSPYVDFVDGKVGQCVDDIKRRAADLFRRAGKEVFATLSMDEIASGREVAGHALDPIERQARRRAVHWIAEYRGDLINSTPF